MGHLALAIRLGLRDLGRGIRLVFAFQGAQRLSQQGAVDLAQGFAAIAEASEDQLVPRIRRLADAISESADDPPRS